MRSIDSNDYSHPITIGFGKNNAKKLNLLDAKIVKWLEKYTNKSSKMN